MADFYSSYWGNNYSPRIRLSVSVANLNGNTARVTWILDYVASGYAAYTNGIARAWSVNIDGQVRSGSYNINGVSSTTRISSGTIDVARGTSTRNISCSASLNFDVTWNGSYSGTRSASGSIGVEKRVSYTVSFNANGGTGAPGNQTKWHGQNITLSSTRPTRTGYIFQGWAKSASGRVEYQPGSAYGIDASVTFYAIWSPETYTISFNANGGSGAPGNQTKTYGQTLTLSSTRPTRKNYNFIGWGTSSGSTSAAYQPGGSYTSNGNATLYAVWTLAYTPPRITNIQADRCNSGGTLSESGTYVKVSFSWATDYNVSAIYIRHKVSTSSSWTTTTVSASGKVGSVSQVIGSNGISTEYTYNIQIEIRDSNGSSIAGRDVGPMLYTIDFKAGGKGVAIGKPATEDNKLDVKFNTRVDGSLSVGGDIHLNGNLLQNGSIWSGYLPAGDTATKEYWHRFPKGRSLWWYGNDSNVKNVPASYGFVEVTKVGAGSTDFSVLLYAQASGQIYRNSGNSTRISGWNDLIQTVQPYYMFNTTRAVAKPWGDISFPWQNTIVQGNDLSVDSTDNTKIKVNRSGWYEFYITGTITGATAGRWYDLGIMKAFDNSGNKYDGQQWVHQYCKRGKYYPPNNKEFVIAQTFTVKLEAGYCNVGSNGDDSTGTISNIWCTFKRIANKNW